jgi:ABC-2 type transport system ATP-binding protein
MVSSHILPELADMCNKIGIIEKGKLEVSTTVADVMHLVRRQIVLRIRVAGDPEPAARLLEQHAGVEKIELADGGLTVWLRDGVKDYSDFAGLLTAAGHKLTLLKEDEMNLETAFMALTKGLTA